MSKQSPAQLSGTNSINSHLRLTFCSISLLLLLSACGVGESGNNEISLFDSQTTDVSTTSGGTTSGGTTSGGTTNGGTSSGGTSNGGTSGTTANTVIQQIEVAQVYSHVIGFDSYQSLVPGRSAIARVYIYTSSTSTLPNPVLWINGSAKFMTCNSVDFTKQLTAPPIRSYDIRATCYANIAKEDVRAGMTLTAWTGTELTVSSTVRPTVSRAKKIEIVVIPMTVNGETPTVDSNRITKVRNHVRKHLPFADITVTKGSTLPIAGDLVSLTEWSNALNSLEAKRVSEAQNKLYFGLAPFNRPSGPFIAGLGFCNDCFDGLDFGQANSNFFSSMGLDLPDAIENNNLNWQRTMLHELGHNLSLSHVSCPGSPLSDTDAAYPYSSGSLSTAAIYDEASGSLIDPGRLLEPYDVMGYCDGDWLSDYHYNKVQAYTSLKTQQSNNQVSFQRIAGVYDDSSTAKSWLGVVDKPNNGFWLLSGKLSNTNGQKKLTLSPIHNQAAAAHNNEVNFADSNTITLSATTSAGRTIKKHLVLSQIADSINRDQYFFYTLPKTSFDEQITRLEYSQAEVNIPLVIDSASTLSAHYYQAAFLSSSITNINDLPDFARLEANNDTLNVQWDAGKYPWLRLFLVSNTGERKNLALNATGGSLSIDTRDLPKGGHWEISMSAGLTVHTQTVAR